MTARPKSWLGQSATSSTRANACAFFAPPDVLDAITVIYTLIAALIWLKKFEVLSLPIPLRILFAAQPQLLAPAVASHPPRHCRLSGQGRALNLAEPTPAWSRSFSESERRC